MDCGLRVECDFCVGLAFAFMVHFCCGVVSLAD